MNRRTTAWAVAFFLFLLAVACGGGSGTAGDTKSAGSAGASKSASRTEYLKKAAAICYDGNLELKNASDLAFAGQKADQPLNELQVADFVEQSVVPTIREQVRRLRALTPPKGDEAKVLEIYAAIDKGLDTLEVDPLRLNSGGNVFAEADRLAKKHGLVVCGTEPN